MMNSKNARELGATDLLRLNRFTVTANYQAIEHFQIDIILYFLYAAVGKRKQAHTCMPTAKVMATF